MDIGSCLPQIFIFFFFFQAEDGIRDHCVTGVQTCALPISPVQQEAYVKAGSRDTVRSRSFTGKPARMLRNDWTEAWEQPDNPKPLGMPLQYMVSGMAVAATHKYPNESVDVAFNPIGQVVGQFTKVEKTSTV